MTDNVHGIGVNDVAESAEQDTIKIKTDLITITSSINLNTVGTNQTNFTNKLSGASSSGLKTLITGNDTDIDNINDKLDMTTGSNMKTAVGLNTAKTSFPGIGTSGSTCLAGNTTTISSSQASKITASENAITAIEEKTDNITCVQAVNLDTMESNIATNNNKTSFPGIGTSGSTCLAGNTTTISSSQASNIATNNNKTSFPGIGTSGSTCLAGNTTTISSSQASNIATNNNKTSFPGIGTSGSTCLAGNTTIISSSQASNIATNNNKTSFPGIGTSGSTCLAGNTTIISSSQASKITASENAITAIEGKTDNIVISSSVNINTLSSLASANQTLINTIKARPQLIALTSLNPATHRTHHFGYGNNYNYNGSFVENTFFYIHSTFRVNFRPLGSIVRYRIKCVIDGYYSSRNIYFAVGSSLASSSIIPSTVTFFKGRNSTWTTRKEQIELYETSLSTTTDYTRYIFCKEVAVQGTNNRAATGGNTGWVIYGGRNNKNVSNQTLFYYELDPTPDNPNNTDNFGALECEVWSSPTGFSTSSSSTANFQYLEY